jgi:hypothetical protein
MKNLELDPRFRPGRVYEFRVKNVYNLHTQFFLFRIAVDICQPWRTIFPVQALMTGVTIVKD